MKQKAQTARDEAAKQGLTLERNVSATGYKFVYKQKRKFWALIIRQGGIVTDLGKFQTPEEAALAVARYLK